MSIELRTNVLNWSNKDQLVTEHFTVGDCLTLHAWNRLASSADGADFNNLQRLCQKMEQIRAILDCPINVHCMFRSPEYNKSQNINPITDVHSMNSACDFDCGDNYTIEEVKELLLPELDKLNIRMEFGTTSWVHIDTHGVGPSGRYFKA